MTVKEFIGTLESSDRLRIIEGKAEVYVGYLAAFKPFADHEISEEYRKYSGHEVKKFRAVPEITHRRWKELGLMKPLEPDQTAQYKFTVGIHGKGGEAGIKAIQQLAGMVDSLKQCQTPQEVYDRYLQITGYCKCCVDCNFIDQKGADELMCLAAYLAGNEQARAEAQQKAGKKA